MASDKPLKYLRARLQGKSKKEAEEIAYNKYNHNSSQIERTKTYREAIKKYLMKEEEALGYLNRNIRQEQDKGASNKALDIYLKLKDLYPKEENELEAGDLIIKVSKK